MTPVAIFFVMPRSKKGHTFYYFLRSIRMKLTNHHWRHGRPMIKRSEC